MISANTQTPLRPEVLDAYVYRIKTPDGVLYVTICDLNDEIFEIHLQIGKSGTIIRAWTNALQNTINMSLRNGVSLIKIIAEVSNITTDRAIRSSEGINIRSGAEGVAYALLKYIEEKKNEREGKRDNKENNGHKASMESSDFG